METTYKEKTNQQVLDLLESARINRNRVRLFYGDIKTGRDWLEENDLTGYVSRSNGKIKVPILLHNSRSIGGGAILDDCIVRMLIDGREVYRTENYQQPNFIIKHEPQDDLSWRVYVKGENIANFRTKKSAERWVAFMAGNRMTK